MAPRLGGLGPCLPSSSRRGLSRCSASGDGPARPSISEAGASYKKLLQSAGEQAPRLNETITQPGGVAHAPRGRRALTKGTDRPWARRHFCSPCLTAQVSRLARAPEHQPDRVQTRLNGGKPLRTDTAEEDVRTASVRDTAPWAAIRETQVNPQGTPWGWRTSSLGRPR